MADLTLDDLVGAVAAYIVTSAGDNSFVQSSTEEAITFIGEKFDSTLAGTDDEDLADHIAAASLTMSRAILTREVKELAADLFYRRQAQNGIVSVNAMDGVVARVSRDPWKASEDRLARWLPLGFA